MVFNTWWLKLHYWIGQVPNWYIRHFLKYIFVSCCQWTQQEIWEFLFLIWQILLWVLSYLVALVVNYNIDILNYWHPKYTKYTNQRGKKKDFLMLDLGRRRSLFLKMTIPQLLNKYLKSNLKDYKHVEGTNWCIGSRVSL